MYLDGFESPTVLRRFRLSTCFPIFLARYSRLGPPKVILQALTQMLSQSQSFRLNACHPAEAADALLALSAAADAA